MRPHSKPLADAGLLGATRHEIVLAQWDGPDGVENTRPPDRTQTVVEWQYDGERITNPEQIKILEDWYAIESGATQ